MSTVEGAKAWTNHRQSDKIWIMNNIKSKITLTADEKNLIDTLAAEHTAELSPFATKDGDAVYLNDTKTTDYRSNFGRDIDSILNNIFYARFGDKTQVHSFYKNDDLTRRSLHVQFVSRIARTIGRILRLNLELIEAVAIGHDIGHTPFGHKGETFLSELYFAEDGKYFNHNVHSVKVLKDISKRTGSRGLSLQTLDGILSHNGEVLNSTLTPTTLSDFAEFEAKYKDCYSNQNGIKTHVANSLEGCLVRICDMLAYVGKDRQDLFNVRQTKKLRAFTDYGIGTQNTDVIKSCSVNIIKNSLARNQIAMDTEIAEILDKMKKQNYEIIYNSDDVNSQYRIIKDMFAFVFDLILKDLKNGSDKTHIRRNFQNEKFLSKYRADITKGKYSNADQAVDYIASMTDDYFVDLAGNLNFPDTITYIGYFEN